MAPVLEKPRLWIIAGPNGSGKSTAYSLLGVDAPQDTVWIINPDLLAKRIAEEERLPYDDANLQAVVRIESWLYASVDAYQTIGVETVLSSGKYRRLVESAKARGFEVNLIYVFVDTAELNIERVRARKQKGGHDVPEDKIRQRRARSFEQLGWFFNAADRAYVVNNTKAELEIVASKVGDEFSIQGGIIPEAFDPVVANYPELKAILDGPASNWKRPE